jgi:hypothetical protein
MLDETGDTTQNLRVRRVIAAICRSTPITLGLGLMGILASCSGSDCDLGYYGECTSDTSADELSFGLVAGDFNGTGRASIIQTSLIAGGDFTNAYVYGSYPYGTGSYLKSYQSTGPGTFAAPVLIDGGHNPLYLATADLNGDHLPDVVSASFDAGAVSVFMNNAASPGAFNAPLVLASPGASQVAVSDVNGDGLMDIISADFNVSLFVQTASGTFSYPIALYSGGANWVAVGDLNGDGTPDIALTDNTGVKVLTHVGAAASTTYAAATVVYGDYGPPSSWGANLIAIADVNGDGLNDLVITDSYPFGGTSPAVEVLLQNPASRGTFLPPASYPIAGGSFPQSIAVADLNGDGLPDVVVGGSDALSVLLQSSNSPGTFAATVNYAVIDANEIAVTDINGDGRPDIVIATGVNHPIQSGIAVNQPGVLLQGSTSPGTFLPVSDLPRAQDP